jgi:hypothetical protein
VAVGRTRTRAAILAPISLAIRTRFSGSVSASKRRAAVNVADRSLCDPPLADGAALRNRDLCSRTLLISDRRIEVETNHPASWPEGD